jgi:hypothetical protein
MTTELRNSKKVESSASFAPFGRTMAKNLFRVGVAGMTLLGTIAQARADEVTPTWKGTIGGALLGAEIVTMTESLIGVRQDWVYAASAAGGALAGGLAGYAVENSVSDGTIPVAMLAGGITLIIPAIVMSLDATRYRPEDAASEDQAPTTGPAPEPGSVGGSVVVGGKKTDNAAPPAAPSPPANKGPQSFLDLQPGHLRLGLPVVEVRNRYSMQQLRDLGVPQATEVRVPLVRVTF